MALRARVGGGVGGAGERGINLIYTEDKNRNDSGTTFDGITF